MPRRAPGRYPAGLLSSTVARELARVAARQPCADGGAIRAHRLTSKQAHRIATGLLRTADPAARAEVLANPLRYRVASEPPTTREEDPRLGKRSHSLLHDERSSIVWLDLESAVDRGQLQHQRRCIDAVADRDHEIFGDPGFRTSRT